MKILNTFNGSNNEVAYVEFIHSGKTKILKADGFKHRFGNTCIDDFEKGRTSKESLHVRLSLQEEKQREEA